jgi:hypothetical protein
MSIRGIINVAGAWLGMALAVSALVAGIAGGAALLLYEAYGWIRAGNWELHSVVTLLQMGGDKWALNPQDWIGLHKFLDVIPLFLALPIAGVLLFVFFRASAWESAGVAAESRPAD